MAVKLTCGCCMLYDLKRGTVIWCPVHGEVKVKKNLKNK